MKGKRLFTILLICFVILSFASCMSEEEKGALRAQQNWSQSSGAQQLEIYCALIKEYMLLIEDLGEDTPYPAMKRSVKGNMMSGGMTQQEALDNAEELLIEEQAVFWCAEQDGCMVTDKEAKIYIKENVLDQLKETEEYARVNAACQKEGITYDDTVWAYEDSYKVDCIASNAGVGSYEELEQFKADAVERFRDSGEYDRYQAVLDVCRSLIEQNVTDRETLKAADIYYP